MTNSVQLIVGLDRVWGPLSAVDPRADWLAVARFIKQAQLDFICS